MWSVDMLVIIANTSIGTFPLLPINRLNHTESAIFSYLSCSVAFKVPFSSISINHSSLVCVVWQLEKVSLYIESVLLSVRALTRLANQGEVLS
jgi:hypothetical protein